MDEGFEGYSHAMSLIEKAKQEKYSEGVCWLAALAALGGKGIDEDLMKRRQADPSEALSAFKNSGLREIKCLTGNSVSREQLERLISESEAECDSGEFRGLIVWRSYPTEERHGHALAAIPRKNVAKEMLPFMNDKSDFLVVDAASSPPFLAVDTQSLLNAINLYEKMSCTGVNAYAKRPVLDLE